MCARITGVWFQAQIIGIIALGCDEVSGLFAFVNIRC